METPHSLITPWPECRGARLPPGETEQATHTHQVHKTCVDTLDTRKCMHLYITPMDYAQMLTRAVCERGRREAVFI